MSERPLNPGQGPGGILLTIGAVFLAVTCCAGPALLAGSGLVLLGGVLATPVVLAIAVLVLAGAVLYTLRRRARARSRARGPSGAAAEAAGPVDGTPGVNDCCATSTPDLTQSGKHPGGTPLNQDRTARP
ncbi:hypothetical protein [Pseudarthrobacter enclensis]|uniref:Iron-regulated membrane protein n=1 Tax=Pseudarthrobacter enclensis TaxID=993070 RepID=A0ABT9RY07_9MICC|nr:hypothetical protein [Pseudarthrobacter enclensis]MDP9890119.1 putative iron-regulated membrane protein [Pseudarthrobacter enclensis]